MKKYFALFVLLLSFQIGLSGTLNAQWVIEKVIKLDHPANNLRTNSNYVFIRSNDTIYVHSGTNYSLIHFEIVSEGTFNVSESLLYIENGNTLDFYDISDIKNWKVVKSFSGLPSPTANFGSYDQDFITWNGHWNQTIDIFDISDKTNITQKATVNTGGNPYFTAKVGDNIFVANAYSASVKININSLSVTPLPFGENHRVYATDSAYLVFTNSGTTNVNTILLCDTLGNELQKITNTNNGQFMAKVFSDNYMIIHDGNNSLTLLYKIENNKFNMIDTIDQNPKGAYEKFGAKYLRVYSDTMVVYSLKSSCICTEYKTVFDTIHIQVSDTIFKTVEVIKEIAVTDTLIINAVLTGTDPALNHNTIKAYPNPTMDRIFIDNGDFVLMAGYRLKIMNVAGVVVFESLINTQLFDLDLNKFGGKGTYFLQIIDGSSQIIEIKKIILQ